MEPAQNNKKSLLVFTFLVCFVFLVYGQPKQLQFNYLTPNDGLSSSTVTSILQDHKGFMWIGTNDGLNRYDGYGFKLFKNNTSNPFSLPSDQVRAIFEDRNNHLLIGSNVGLSLYDWDKDQFINYMSEDSSPFYGIDCDVHNIVEDSLGNLWFSTEIALMYFDRINNTAVQYTHDPDNPESLSNSWVEYVFVDSKNRVWVSTRGGLNLFQPQTKTFKRIARGENVDDDYSDIDFIGITEDHDGNIWIGSENGLFCLKNTSTGQDFILSRYQYSPDDKFSISDKRLLSVFVDHENNLWVGAENGGLFLFDRENQKFWHYKPDDYDIADINNESIECIYMDNKDNLWVGTFGGGVNISPKYSDAIFHYENLKGGELSLSSNVVSSFLCDHDGQIWVGTDGGGLNRFNENTKRFTRFNINNSDLSSNAILSLVEESNHNIWIGTWGGGLVKYNHGRNSFTSFTTQNSKIPDDNIFSIAEGSQNDLWMGSFTNGLIHYQIDKNEFTSYSQSSGLIEDNYIFVVKTGSNGQLYLGTSTGMRIFSPAEGLYVSFTHDPDNPNSISHEAVYDILVENDTCVWVATQNGLNRFNPETQVFKRYYMEDGLPNNVIKSLLVDNSGILWVSTNQGICRFDYQHNKYDLFTKDDGLQSNEFNSKCALRLNNGNLLFGGTNGFNLISPDRIIKNLNIPEILITDFFLFNNPVNANTEGSPLAMHISDSKEIKLPHNQSVLTFYFAVMDFTMPEKNQYAYMLENFDDGWIYSGSKREATYTNLDPGDYIFRVKGSNNDGIWNEEGTALKITILPPWWLTLWFKGIFSIFIIAVILAIFYIRTSNLRKQKKVLTKKVQERTKDLQNKNIQLKQKSDDLNKTNSLLKKRQLTINKQSEELKTQAEELKVIAENLEETNTELTRINATKDMLFSIIAHDLKNPFNVILGYTDLLLSNFNDWESSQSLEILGYIKESSANAYNLLENLLHWSRSQRGVLEFNPSPTNAAEIINMVFTEVISFARKKEVEIVNLFNDESLQVNADPDMLTLICRNLLMNAIKFSNTGNKVFIDIEDDATGFVRFSVSDQGVGMEKEKVESLFNMEKTSSTRGTDGEKGTGLGLVLCKEFVLLHKGRIWVESKVNEGATFFFTIPKTK
ncbi:MAG: hypothetical protein HQ541_07385 [Mariniphaga sp.]|nr:hypothetical protein [Mariniphaga sp.]